MDLINVFALIGFIAFFGTCYALFRKSEARRERKKRKRLRRKLRSKGQSPQTEDTAPVPGHTAYDEMDLWNPTNSHYRGWLTHTLQYNPSDLMDMNNSVGYTNPISPNYMGKSDD